MRTFKLISEKKKDELLQYQKIIKEIQAEHTEAASLGKVFHQLMVSRWSEASTNRKYDSAINEKRMLRQDIFNKQVELQKETLIKLDC